MVERPVETLEQDLVKLINTKNYQHNYLGLEVIHDAVQKHGIEYVDNNLKFEEKVAALIESPWEIRKYGMIYSRNGDMEDAIAIHKFNLLLFPESEASYYSIAETYFHNGDFSLAEKHFEKVLEIAPDNNSATKYLSEIREEATSL